MGVLWMNFAECCDRFNHASVILAAHQPCQKKHLKHSILQPYSLVTDCIQFQPIQKSKSDTLPKTNIAPKNGGFQ